MSGYPHQHSHTPKQTTLSSKDSEGYYTGTASGIRSNQGNPIQGTTTIPEGIFVNRIQPPYT